MEAEIKQQWFGIAQYIEFPRILSLSSINRDWHNKLTPFQSIPHAEYPDAFDCYNDFIPANNIQLKILRECRRLSKIQSRQHWCFRLTSVKLKRLPDMGFDECYGECQFQRQVFGDPVLQSLRFFYSLTNVRRIELIGVNYFNGDPKYANGEFLGQDEDEPPNIRDVYLVGGAMIEPFKLIDGRLLQVCKQLRELIFDYYYFDENSMQSLEFRRIQSFQCNHYAGINNSLELISVCMPMIKRLTLNHQWNGFVRSSTLRYISRLQLITYISISNIRAYDDLNRIGAAPLNFAVFCGCTQLEYLLLRLDKKSNAHFINQSRFNNISFGKKCTQLLSLEYLFTIQMSAGFLDPVEMASFRAAHSTGRIDLTLFTDVQEPGTNE